MSTEHNISDMIANPSSYGFEWGYGALHHKEMRIAERAPHIVHVNLELMRATFGDSYFLDSANTRSARVRDQTLRNDIYDDRPLAKDDLRMKTIVLERALGRVSRKSRVTVVEKIVEKRVFVANDGTEFTDKAEMMAHNVDLQLAEQDQ